MSVSYSATLFEQISRGENEMILIGLRDF